MKRKRNESLVRPCDLRRIRRLGSEKLIRRTHYVFVAEEAHKSVKGVPENLVHTKYVELVW